MAVVTFKIPTRQVKGKGRNQQIINGVEERQGMVAWLPLGDEKVKFIIQQNAHGAYEALTHYASGMRVSGLNDVQVRWMVRYGHHAKLSPRRAAEEIWSQIVATKGVDEVRQKLASAEIINP